MDSKDKDEKETSNTVSTTKLAWLKQRLVELKALEIEVNAHPDKQISRTDPDARLMKIHYVKKTLPLLLIKAISVESISRRHKT